ncbi:hypothetical protein GCM10011367_17310 [Marinicauda pacifica]|uniref:Nuclear transport factor 2 family protein n=1 Tax=Marinicauda pacifica TaxID=1133559 RepID=A0A4S2HB29_9PROT|nr:hypothetical protein [Marinicauda pacifica]TGY93137.1 hypothetical protein E5162_08730 [Marinicauda pacifica]GGE43170.1 hypothetical protein GCM10011367_17310 [Marinicauda pacifica]
MSNSTRTTILAGPELLPEARAALKGATQHYGEAFRRFNAETVIEMLADDVVYESQALLEPITGKHAVAEYLRKRYRFFAENMGDQIEIIPAEIGLPKAAKHPCLILARGEERDALLVLTLDGTEKVRRIDLLFAAPRPEEARVMVKTSARARQ